MSDMPERAGASAWPRRLVRAWAAILLLLGVILFVGGIDLALLGGSPYYVLAGTALAVAAILLWRFRALGVTVYGWLVGATTVWAWYESSFDGWALAPRILPFLLVGLPCLVPAVRRMLVPALPRLCRSSPALAILLLLAGTSAGVALRQPYPVLPFPAAPAAPMAAAGDWTAYGRTPAGTRFAPFAQINRDNVGNLAVAWRHATGIAGSSQATPLQIGETMYSCGGGGAVEAIDVDTGQRRWLFDPQLDRRRVGILENCRGVSFARTPRSASCPERIVWGTADGHLFAVNARTGLRCADFGGNGEIDLLDGIRPVDDNAYWVTSPPMILRDLAITGAAIVDGGHVNAPAGVVRAFDVRTGQLRWAWDPALDEPVTTLSGGRSFTRATPNAWSVLSADPALGLVYVPTGVATPDFAAAHRSARADRFGSSVVALEVDTGRVRWSFQTTHHDKWDYDVPAQPVLADLADAGGAPIHALLASTKRGEVFMLDRLTGKPLAKVEERRVPAADSPGEWASPTQPFSTGFPAFGRDRLTEARMWGITPIDQMLCRIAFRKLRYDGVLTPPSVRGTLQYPGYAGGMNWGSVTIDEDHHVMIATFLNIANTVRLIPHAQFDGKAGPFDFPQLGTPYAAEVKPFLSPIFTPCQQPPFSEMVAVDLSSRKVLWRIPLGAADQLGPLGLKSHLPLTMGVISRGGAMVTRGGLVFFGGTMDRRLRAFDIRTGETLWTARLPRHGQATPMSYVSPRTGRQYVVITVPGEEASPLAPHQGSVGTKMVPPSSDSSGAIIAYALPAQ